MSGTALCSRFVIPAQAGIQFEPRAPLPTPHPNPLPQGERGLEASDAWLLTLPCFAFDVPPVTAPSITARGDRGPRLFGAGRGRMPMRPSSGQGWPVDGPRHEREAQGTPKGRSCREAAFFGYFLALLPKSNSPAGENPRLHSAKAVRRVNPLDSGFRGNDESKDERTAHPLDTRCFAALLGANGWG